MTATERNRLANDSTAANELADILSRAIVFSGMVVVWGFAATAVYLYSAIRKVKANGKTR